MWYGKMLPSHHHDYFSGRSLLTFASHCWRGEHPKSYGYGGPAYLNIETLKIQVRPEISMILPTILFWGWETINPNLGMGLDS